MAITLDSTSSFSNNASNFSFDHTCTGDNLVLLVSISMIPDAQQECISVKYNNVDMTLVTVCQIEDKSRTELWMLNAPSLGTNTIEVVASSSVNALLVSATYGGVAQSDNIYNLRSSAGLMVDSLGVKSFSKIGGIAIGLGTTDNVNSHIDTLYGTQVRDWDYIGNGVRSEAISAQLPFDNDSIAVPNVLTVAANYAIIIIGLVGA